MGICFSKKKKKSPDLPPPTNPIPNDPPKKKRDKSVATAPEVVAVEKKPVFVITHKNKPIAIPPVVVVPEEDDKKEDKQQQQLPKKKTQQEEPRKSNAGASAAATAAEELRVVAAVRTSSCTKEEVDAILIQCGRLSRSPSGNNPNESGGAGHRRYSGSKRSFDFDNERRGDEEEWEKRGALRPSPHRRTPSRERGDGGGAGGEYKRSGSRERGHIGGGGGRRVSRSPGRRSDGPAAASSGSSGDKPKQPAKMVSVPPREKGTGAGIADSAGGLVVKKASPVITNRKGGVSPRSRSPANTTRASGENASLSRSSSRKAEHSSYRRSPMAEIDDNTLKEEQQPSRITNKMNKPNQSQSQKTSENRSQISNGLKSNNNIISNCVREQLMSCRAKEQQQAEPEKIESLNPRALTRSRSSRRSSRDLDADATALLVNPNTHNSQILEDIHHYHYNSNTPAAAFSLPSCVSKACSIVEAVADLNSSVSFSDSKSYDADGSNSEKGRFGRRPELPFMESEIVVKDNLMEPSLHKYVTVRGIGGGETEPQESAGSNSFIGQPWASPWGPNSVDSTDRCWTTSRSNNGEEMEEEEEEQSRDFEDRGRRLRLSSTTTAPSGKKKEPDYRSGIGSNGGRKAGGGRANSVTAASASSLS